MAERKQLTCDEELGELAAAMKKAPPIGDGPLDLLPRYEDMLKKWRLDKTEPFLFCTLRILVSLEKKIMSPRLPAQAAMEEYAELKKTHRGAMILVISLIEGRELVKRGDSSPPTPEGLASVRRLGAGIIALGHQQEAMETLKRKVAEAVAELAAVELRVAAKK